MTRWARAGLNKKVCHDATSWKNLKTDDSAYKPKPHRINKYKRSEHRRIKRIRKREANKVCFHCRMPGHGMADCPMLKDDIEQGVDICFKCGSTEHSASVCTAKITEGKEYMFAKCFVCGESGHLSRSCPDNPRGLYPDGGGCPLCGSVEHFKKDCPDRPVKDEVTVYRLPANGHCVSVDDEMSLYEDVPVTPKRANTRKHKVVKF